MAHQVSDAMSADRPIAGLIWRLEAEGWAFAEQLIIRPDGQLNWIVSGSKGPHAIRSQGASMAEAWMGAAEQARCPTPAVARLAPPRSPWIISYGSESSPDPVSVELGDRHRPDEAQLGRISMALDNCVQYDGAIRQQDKPKPKHRICRRPDGKVARGKDYARRTNPHR